jgi:L-aminopeptidase/D-esterase-like protein
MAHSDRSQSSVNSLRGSLTDVGLIKVGHFVRKSRDWLTGTTVILAPLGATAGVDVRGGGPGTRETDLLRPENLIQKVHAIVLSGGSAYGLASAQGVMEFLEETGSGFSVGKDPSWVVPIVPGAVIFDLGRGGKFANRPDSTFGYRAAKLAKSVSSDVGCVGAGLGARSGGLKGGLGMASTRLEDGHVVSALAVVNSIGSLINPDTCLPWHESATRLRRPNASDRRMLRDYLSSLATPVATVDSPQTTSSQTSSLNTTIGAVATNLRLSKSECTKFAAVAHDGLARAVRPAHLMNDGDTIFGLSVGPGDLILSENEPIFSDPVGRPALLNKVLAAGADMFAQACTEAILRASSCGGMLSYRELCPSAFVSQ